MSVPATANWLVAQYAPVSLFSLKPSFATSSVGTTLVLPTPYAIKMALIDSAFGAGLPATDCDALLQALVSVPVRVAPPEAVVTHTFSKIRQEPKKRDDLQPYISNIAYREFVSHHGEWRWAFGGGDDGSVWEQVARLLPHVRSVGKRGSFVQYLGHGYVDELGQEYTLPLADAAGAPLPARCHVVPLDDFGPEATLDVLNSFSETKAKRERHRTFVETIVPLARARTGPGFTEYRR